MKKSTSKLHDMKKKRDEGEYKNRTNKERVLIDREIDRLERFFGGVADMEDVPDVLIVVDTKREIIAVKEANMADVTSIGIVDSNADPTIVNYPIPMNDDASKGIEYVLDLIKDAIISGKGQKTKAKSGSKKESKGTKKNKTEKSGKKSTSKKKKSSMSKKTKKSKEKEGEKRGKK